MDPLIENDWLGPKQEAVEEVQNVPNLARSWLGREMDIEPLRGPANKTVLENMAEDILVQKKLTSRCCDLPGYPRSTFLMVFSPDGTKVASTHGNHNVYVSELASGKHVRILKGHPRTPWCIAFHPSHPQLIGSGCLGGQVRVWDLSGGSEVWTVSNETVIASMAFHPRDQLLVIATFNELYFWDWSQPAPLTKVCTRNTNEKVRYVAFDSLGYKLITGISSVWGLNTSSNTTTQNTPSNQSSPNTNNQSPGGGGDQRPDQPGDRTAQPQSRSLDHRFNHDIVFNSYHNLVQRYDSLTDRGTDPMETDTSLRNGHSSRAFRPWAPSDDGPSRPQNYVDSVDNEASSSRLSLDVLNINGDPTRSVDSNDMTDNESSFASRTSAFQRFTDELELHAAANPDPPPRLLPNPFSASVSAPRLSTDGSSRTTVFTSRRLDSPSARYFLQRRRNAAALNIQTSTSTSTNTLPQDDELSRSLFLESRRRANSRSGSSRPSTSNASMQFCPAAEQTINESLDLIRDILRDSGTRLLNLITNMSLSTLASVERSMPRRQRSSLTESDGSDVRNASLRRDLLVSESDTDSDHSASASASARDTSRTSSAQDDGGGGSSSHLTHDHSYHSTRRLDVDLNEHLHSGEAVANELNRPNVSTSPGRFRVRSHSTEENASRENNNRNATETQDADDNQPSTSRDTSWMDDAFEMGPVMLSSEAISKVKTGVSMLHRHTTQLTEIWLRGTPMSMAELRNTWEDLRRRIVALNRSNNPSEAPRYFTRNLIDRCRYLADSLRNSHRHRNMNLNNEPRNRERSREPNADNQQAPTSTDSTSSSIATDVEEPSRRSELRANFRRLVQRARVVRRRGNTAGRWRGAPEDDEATRPRPRRRLVHLPPVTPRWCLRHSHRLGRRDLTRSFEVHVTRHEIRMRAMQVLSIMFNMMMSCLERRALSQIIIHMLKTLKKALALSCLMLVTSRLTRRTNETQTRGEQTAEEEGGAAEAEPGTSGRSRQEENDAAERANRLNVLNNITRQRFTDHNADSTSSWPEFSDSEDEDVPRNKKMKVDTNATSNEPKDNEPSTSTAPPPPPPRPTTATQRWSNRLAVQISAANRNTSITARRRHAFYVETRRLKALHRTNPMAHPISRKKIKPPLPTHRIPIVRRLPPSAKKPKTTQTNRLASSASDEPVAGPSNSQPGPSGGGNSPREGSSREVMNDFEHRVSLVRIAHMHAVRMRNAARNRFRRLQTIRLYTPSAVREMFALQSNNNDLPNATDNQNQPTSNNDSDVMYPASFGLYRPHIMTTRNDAGNRAEGSRPYDYVIPLLDEGAAANEPQNGQPQRLPRIQEYLQPIILAQNALVVEEGGGGGGLGHIHLDSGPLSEALPPSAHRVQAWDFSTGSTPDIADSTKNIVVPRCRIHNDASIDISKDGKLLVALLPVPRFRNGHDVLGIYSLEWGRLGQCLHTAILEQSAVSVALSPTARHLAVGLGSRRFTTLPHARNNVFALLYNLTGNKKVPRHGLTPVKELEQNWEQGFTSLNCLRWAPQPGQGLVYANNTGQLIVMS